MVGNAEIRWPAKNIDLLPGEPVEVGEEDGGRLIERFGMAGVITCDPGEPLEASLFKAREKRHDFLARLLQNYREDQGRRKAMGLEILLPRAEHRAIFREFKALEKILLASDEILQGAFQERHPRQDAQGDPLNDELRAFGIPPQAASALPMEAQGLPGLEVL